MKTLIKAVALLAGAVSIAVLSGCESASATKEEGFKGTLNVVSQTAVAAKASSTGIAALAAIPANPPIPSDNKQSDAKVELGKLLFFDPILGGDASISCASCHEPSQGWAWAEDFSRGYPGTVHWRNSQSIMNSGYYPGSSWANSVISLEKQALSAAKAAVEGNGENDIMEARMALIPEYRKRFNEVFGDEYPIISNAWRAIASFERTINQTDTPIDRYLKGDKKALSEQQVRGKAVFEGKGNCIQCHNGALASDMEMYNIGVPPAKRWEEDGLAQITFRFELYAKGSNEELYRTAKADPGAYFRGKNKWDLGKFRTPSLRYTMYTAPYMHNGAFYTLDEVVDFYNKGGFDEDNRTTGWPKTKSKLIKPLGLSDDEKADLVAFIESFSGDEILMDKPDLPDYAPMFTLEELKEAKK
ncbi:MAG: hypothetical protein LC437_03065 [Thiohalomonas sp.]|nr:hypothetical protein [Thiohalomonas sp.]